MTTEPKPLNKVEIWVADHAVPIFLVIALAIVLGAGAVFWTWQQQGDTAEQVKVIAPQVTRIDKAICDRASLNHPARARACAERIRIGLVNCRRSSRCRAAYLALATYPPPARSTAPSSTTATTTAPSSEGGDAVHQPSHQGHQQPGPSGGQQEGGQEPSPAPSPGASVPPAPGGGPPAETPGNGAQGGQGGSSASGVGVEVCAELVNTCVGAEVGLGH